MKRRYDWIRDLPDHRDYSYKKVKVKIPAKVDLRPECSPVEDQGDLGSCTANAGVGVYEILEYIQKMVFADMSRLFLYYNTRVIEGTVPYDDGASIRDTFKALAKYGVCFEKSWPYIIKKFATKPSINCYAEGLKHKPVIYTRLSTLDDLLNCLAAGFPFEFGFSVYESFESLAVEKTGVVPMPKKNERMLGGHAVVGVGYDQTKRWVICRNSWGPGWGAAGYFYLSFNYISNPNLAADFWTVKKET